MVFAFGLLVLTGCNLLKSKCDACDGSGRISCISCNGMGTKDDTWCNGTGKRNCTDCNGMGKTNVFFPQQMNNGYQLATYMGQTEYVFVYGNHYADFPCQKCGKSGKVKCSSTSCVDGKQDCSFCYATGKTDCIVCGGTGEH